MCLHVNIPIPKLSYSKILKTPIFKFLYFFSDLRILKHLNFYIFTSWIVWMLRSSHVFAFLPSSRPRIAESEGIPGESFLLFLSRNELPSGGGGDSGCSVALFDCRFNPRYIPWNRRPPIRITLRTPPGGTLPSPSIIIVLLVLVGPTSTRCRRPTIGRRDARRRHGDRPSSTRAV